MSTIEYQLPPAELNQQVEISMRLLRMALHGVPRITLDGSEDAEIIALRALMTAFIALAKTSGVTSREALTLLIDANAELLRQRTRRQVLGKEPLIKVCFS